MWKENKIYFNVSKSKVETFKRQLKVLKSAKTLKVRVKKCIDLVMIQYNDDIEALKEKIKRQQDYRYE